MIKPSQIRFAEKSLERSFDSLREGSKSEQELYNFLNKSFENIKKNAFCGIQVPKKQIPKIYAKKYGIENVWKYNLPKGWRLIYSITTKELVVVSIMLDWLDHKGYERKFQY